MVNNFFETFIEFML